MSERVTCKRPCETRLGHELCVSCAEQERAWGEWADSVTESDEPVARGEGELAHLRAESS